MKVLKYPFLGFLYCVLILSWACNKEKVDPTLKADLDETVTILESYLQQPEEFDVYIYTSLTTNPDDFFLKTTNHQVYFKHHTLIVNPNEQSFSIDKFKLLRSEHKTSNTSEINKINRLELYFSSDK